MENQERRERLLPRAVAKTPEKQAAWASVPYWSIWERIEQEAKAMEGHYE